MPNTSTSNPAPGFSPDTLPILRHRAEIEEAIRNHPVVVVCGETGSGKTTQIPKICLAMGRGRHGLIACTQPRRIAALSVAERVGDELEREFPAWEDGTPAGRNLVGWQHRFSRHMPRGAKIKFMTDGILLAELRSDPLLRAYDTIMVDEAHERTLNIDFILGCLKRILPRRPDLRVIVSSATLETKAFSEFFGGAPVVNVPGRTYPVEVRYRPMASEDSDLAAAVADSVAECLHGGPSGDILVFLSGERDIRAAQEAIEGRGFPHTETIPLLASLPPGEQRRAFRTIPGTTRIVLATNVAETSVTIPGVRYVIDSGVARIARYSPRAHVKRLHVEAVSQASANQRKGRCGRIGPGICLRLYSEEDFAKRPAWSDPEIRRTSLAGTLLSMLDWKLGDIADFPFLQPPASAAVREARRQLLAIEAVREDERDGSLRITQLGRRLARLPLEPSLSRILFEADSLGSLRDALIVVSALSCEDPLVRPAERAEAATQAHAQWRDPASDFAAIVNVWRFFFGDTDRSRSATRRLCEKNFVSYRRLCEWRDVHDELERALIREGLDVRAEGGGAPGLHKALLSGLLPNIGVYDPEERNYKGAGGTRFWLFPGSGLAKAKKAPAWVVCGELVDTSRLFARRVAAIDPEWIEPLARAVARYAYSGETWDPVVGTARALRRCIVYGLTVQDGVRCDISRVNPALCREIFIRDGLVGGAFPKPVPPFVKRNLETIAEATETARKTRSSSLEFALQGFCERYDEILPASCVNVPALRDWLKAHSAADAEGLLLRRERPAEGEGRAVGFPDHVELCGRRLAFDYVHKQGAEDDGINLEVRPEEIPLLRYFEPTRLVPGALRAKIVYLLRTLPHGTSTILAAACGENVRAPDSEAMADAILAKMDPEGPLPGALVETLARDFGVRLPYDTWNEAELPAAFRIRFKVLSRGEEVFATRDPDELFAFSDEYAKRMAARGGKTSPFPVADRPVGSLREADGLPDSVRIGSLDGRPIVGYPAVCRVGEDAWIRTFRTRREAERAHPRGLARLAGRFCNLLPPLNAKGLLEDATERALLETFGLPRGRSLPSETRALQSEARTLARQLRDLGEIIEEESAECLSLLDDYPNLLPATVQDVAGQIAWLTAPGFLAETPSVRLAEFPRYFDAIRRRLERANVVPREDVRKLGPVRDAWLRYTDLVSHPESHPPFDAAKAEEYRWLLEEYRVSVFAQVLGTPVPASLQRLDRLWKDVERLSI